MDEINLCVGGFSISLICQKNERFGWNSSIIHPVRQCNKICCIAQDVSRSTVLIRVHLHRSCKWIKQSVNFWALVYITVVMVGTSCRFIQPLANRILDLWNITITFQSDLTYGPFYKLNITPKQHVEVGDEPLRKTRNMNMQIESWGILLLYREKFRFTVF